jgi:hypothetical protein
MAPVPLQPHSCRHCQRLVIDIRRHSKPDIEFVHFQFNMLEILAAATDNCRFCQWLLDKEWVHRVAVGSAVVDKLLAESNKPQHILPPSVFGVLVEHAFRDSQQLPPPNPRNTLCHLAEEYNRLLSGSGASQFDDLTLACLLYQGLEIRFFGLWDPVVRQMACRTRYGFSVFTTSGKSVLFHHARLFYVIL